MDQISPLGAAWRRSVAERAQVEHRLSRHLDTLSCAQAAFATCEFAFENWNVETLQRAVSAKKLTEDEALDLAQRADASLTVRY